MTGFEAFSIFVLQIKQRFWTSAPQKVLIISAGFNVYMQTL
ncbi:hypothetical Protein YC6258_01663 [Gynuella sunshinyii YC6258]|uniref:Uncharacterized protein n=1 Tax=Gynuella sunshinyii YC6258 TaxID=1445510 RepID=A0A0C5VHH9_9GAMM|nr:hypothetical Protein YC6258_01663 [Gynuella sunshinyii YC6258]